MAPGGRVRLTIVGGCRDAWSVWLRGRWKRLCARVARPAWSRGPSTSPLGAAHVKRLAVLCAVGFPLVAVLSGCEHYLAIDIRNDTTVTVTLCGSEPMRDNVCKSVEPAGRASFKWGSFKVVSGRNETIYSPRFPTREERLINLHDSAIYMALQNDGRI
jgi:hypothetical protein